MLHSRNQKYRHNFSLLRQVEVKNLYLHLEWSDFSIREKLHSQGNQNNGESPAVPAEILKGLRCLKIRSTTKICNGNSIISIRNYQ